MTEPHGGADPTLFTTRAVLDGDEWVINGEKWFSSNARYAEFLIVIAVTDPDAKPLPAHVDLHRADRHPRGGDRPQRRRRRRAARSGRQRRLRPLQQRARARRPPAGRAGQRLRRSPRPASAAAASTTPCARSRLVAARARPDVRAGGRRDDPRRPAGRPADGAGADRRHRGSSWSSSACWCCAPPG